MGRINKTNKTTPVSADEFIIYDSEDTSDDKNVTLGQIATFTESQDTTVTGTKIFANGVQFQKGNISFGQYSPLPTTVGSYVASYVSPVYGPRILGYNGSAYQDLSIGSMPTASIPSIKSLANGDVVFGYNVTGQKFNNIELTSEGTTDLFLANDGTYKESNVVNYAQESIYSARKDFLVAGSTHSTVKICAGTLIKCTLSSKEYKLKQLVDFEFDAIAKLDTGTALTAGKDYSIYLVENVATTSGLDFKVSLNGTYPTGYSATTAYKIGGFHTECVSVTSANAPALTANTYWTTHPAIGYNAGDIIPISIWTLLHRPISDPSGMVYINILNMWADIYLQSGTGSLTKSVFGGTTTDTRTQIQHQMDLALVGKRPMTDYEFMVAAEGSNQRTNISGSADPVTTGGHLDTANKRMTSGWFLEDCCGALWQWLVTALGSASASACAEYPDTARGQYYWNTYYFLAGGYWGDGAGCGSWSRDGADVRSGVNAGIGCRGVSLPLFN